MRGMFWRRPRASRECLHNGTHHFVRVQPSRRPFGCEYMPEPRELLHQPRIPERLLFAKIDARARLLGEFFHTRLWYHQTQALAEGLADKFALRIRRREQKRAR